MIKYIFGKPSHIPRQSLIKQIFEAHNKIRKDPKAYITKLEEYLEYFKLNTLYLPNQFPVRTSEGQKAVKECIDFLKSQKSLEELKYSWALS